MPVIELETIIDAPVERCFNLARSIELHMLSTRNTSEKAVAGKTTGLIGLGEKVTWRAKHFGIWQKLTSKITGYQYPIYFCDEMVQGVFQYFRHEHYFKEVYATTIMQDIFQFESPLGIIGRGFDRLVLTEYMQKLLLQRNAVIKSTAEGEQWKKVLPENISRLNVQ